MLQSFTVTPIRQDFLAKVREQGLDDQNQAVIRSIAQGGEPCRDALRRAEPGERIILASYCPFRRAGPYREYGAVFVLQQPDNQNEEERYLPWHSGSSTNYLSADKPVVLRAYDTREQIAAAMLVLPNQIEAGLNEYFSRDEVHFVLLRFAAYGCYGLRVDRARASVSTNYSGSPAW